MAIRLYKYCLVSAFTLLCSFAGMFAQDVAFTRTEITCHGAEDASMKMERLTGSSTYWFVYLNLTDPSKSDSVGPTTNLSYTFLNIPSGDLVAFYVRDVVTGSYLGSVLTSFADKAELAATVTSVNITCFGANTGSITFSSPSGGSGVYEYSINGGTNWRSSPLTFGALPAGFYNVQIRDRNNPGCIKILNPNLQITQPAQLDATVTSSNVTCFGKNNGSIVISAPVGGGGTYEYSRNGGTSWQASGTYSPLPPATYNVVIRDKAVPGCRRTLDPALIISQPATLNVTDIVINKGLTCNEGSDGELQAIVTGGTAPYTYDWFVNNSGTWVSLDEHNAILPNVSQNWYEVRVNDANNCGSPTPPSAGEYFFEVFTDSISPVFNFESASVISTCQGQNNGSIDISASGGKKPYKFSITTGGASGYQSDSLFINLAAGVYQTWTMDKKGCKKQGPSQTVTTTPNAPVSVSIVANPAGSICPGTSVTFTATPVNGGTTPVYQWFLNGNPVGSGGPTYTNTTLANGDQVRVRLTSSLRCTTGNPANSNTITASLKINTAISSQPLAASVCVGQNAMFTVVAVGTNLTYQWRKNGVNIPGATLSSYIIGPVVPADAGNYSVVITGDCGVVTSNSVALTVNPTTAINTQPVPLTRCIGQTATFTVGAVGTNLTYQWRKNGISIPGATLSAYTIAAVVAGDAGNYSVVVTGNCGPAVTSNSVALTVNPTTAINTQPVPLTRCIGQAATFTVGAVGANLTYQWRKNGVNIPLATGSAYTIAAVVAGDAGNYSVVVTGDCGVVTSNSVALTVNPTTAINTQPVPLTRCIGQAATFTVGAVGANLTYQWRKNGVNIPLATGSAYTIAAVVAGDAGNYSVVVTGDCGPAVTSNSVALTVNPTTAITTQPLPLTRCVGQAATFTVGAVGANLTYQWRKNGVNIPLATGSAYTIAAVVAGDAGNYSVVVTGDCGPAVTSNSVALTVNPTTAITTQPLPLTRCIGQGATFSVVAVGANLTYQWRKNGVNIPLATLSAYTIAAVVAGDAGNYSVVVTGDCGPAVTSNSVALTVNPTTAINAQPVPLTRCIGQAATFTVGAVGANLTYQWRKNGVNIPLATGSAYTIAAVVAGDAGNYSVVVTGNCGPAVTSNSVALTVNPTTAITTQPLPLTRCIGQGATFSVVAVGANLTYQWRKNGVNIPLATLSSYTIAAVVAGDAGNYSVVVTGDCGPAVTSNSVALTVNPTTAITTQPLPLTRCIGQAATFSVVAVGANLTYQWRKNGVNIPLATGNAYTIAAVVAGDAGNYSVVVTGDCGPAVTSNSVALTVNPTTAITTQPLPLTRCVGQAATFTVVADGVNLAYQWRKNGINIPLATGSAYTIAAVVAGDAGNYSVVVTGDCGPAVTSNSVALTVNPTTAITTQPLPLTRCIGQAATFSVVAVGANLTYQWRKNGVNIPLATGNAYTIAAVVAGDDANYSVVVTGDCGPAVTSNSVALTVNPTTLITTQPIALTRCVGEAATFTVDADGVNLLYQWRKNGVNIPSATSSAYTIAAVAAGDAGNYSVVITGDCGVVTSNTVALTVNEAPDITTQPIGITECPGKNVTFTVAADGLNLTYLWRRNGIPLVPAQTNAALTLTNIDAADAGNYDVIVSNPCGNVTSNTATLVVADVPKITVHPSDQEVCEGSDVTFNVTATGTGLTYQWRRNGTNLAGQTSPALSLNDVTPAQSGNIDVLVYGLCDTLTSITALFTVNPATTVTSIDSDTLVCEGSTVEFNLTAVGQGILTYQWQRKYAGSWIDITDGGDFSGTATPDLRIVNAEIADTGYYRCFITSGCGSINSDPIKLEVNQIIATIGTPAPFMINAATTRINVSVDVTDRNLYWDLGFALVAPDGTEVILKGPRSSLCIVNPNNNRVNALFTNKIDKLSGDTINWCINTKLITGTFAATGNWNLLNGKDPSNGAWQVRVYDAYNASAVIDGYLKSATLSFTDLNTNGDSVTVSYNSGNINEAILNPIAGELRATSFVVPIRLMTSCFNTFDARAVVTVQGGIAPFTYQWTGPTNVPDEPDVLLGPGTYSVLVTDALGCTSVATVDVTAPPDIIFDDVKHTNTISCFGASEGVIRSKASGGSGSFIYTLMPGNIASSVADSGVFLNLTAGTYTIRATDINGCSLDSVVTIAQRPELTVQIDIVPVVGVNPGSITLTASGGTPPYQYSIDNGTNLQPSGVFNNLPAGIYQVYVVDANNCTFTQDVNLTVTELGVDVTIHDVSCHGLADGSFFLVATEGIGPYTLTASWLADPQTSPSGLFPFTGQTGGSYDVKIEDSQGWIFMDVIEIVEPADIIASDNITDASCNFGTDDGAIDITVSGGAGGYTFDWSNDATTEDLSSIDAGNYSVVISDANGCSSVYYYSVIGINTAFAFAGDDVSICPDVPYQLEGNAGDSVLWWPAEFMDNAKITEPVITLGEATTFYYTVYQNGCYDIDTIAVGVFEKIGMEITTMNIFGEMSTDTAFYINEGFYGQLSGTQGFASYLWRPDMYLSDTISYVVITTPLNDVYYVVIGTTLDGCIETDTVHVMLIRPLEIFTGFSPNGDGMNDRWVIGNAIQYGDMITVKVFNRWGEPVFESKGYGGSQEWDGTRNGKPMPVGAYYYIIDVKDGKSKPYTGTVTILR